MRYSSRFPLSVVLAGALLTATVAAQPAERAEIDALRAQVKRLEEQIRTINRQLGLAAAVPAVAAGATPADKPALSLSGPQRHDGAGVTATDHGYAITSADGANLIRLRALLHVDSRVFFDDGGISNNMFTLRRARLITEGTLARNFSFQFVPEFGGNSVSILDANLVVRLTDALDLKVGKYKTPVGLEVLQSDSATGLTERSMLAGLLPNRDLGVQLGGTFADRQVSFTLGVFNGIGDGANSTNGDFDEGKDVVGRVIATPFKKLRDSPLSGLAIGVGASEGRRKTAAGRAAGYRTDGQQLYFSYQPGVVADGPMRRVSPQLDYRFGAFGLMGEYVVTSAELRPSAAAPKREIRHTGWQMSAGYVVTGEASTYAGVTPRHDFDLLAGTWGALQVVGRYATVDLDADAFPAFTGSGTSAKGVNAGAVGLTWYLSKAVLFKFDFYHSEFELPAGAVAVPVNAVLRQDEKAFVSRFQLSF